MEVGGAAAAAAAVAAAAAAAATAPKRAAAAMGAPRRRVAGSQDLADCSPLPDEAVEDRTALVDRLLKLDVLGVMPGAKGTQVPEWGETAAEEWLTAFAADSPGTATTTVPGLRNLGNSCFINALLQALASCTFFVKFCQLAVDQANPGTATPVLGQFLHVLRLLQPGPKERASDTLNISQLRSNLLSLSKVFTYTSQQQDTDELLHILLDAFDKRLRANARGQVERDIASIMRGEDRAAGAARPALVPNPLQGTTMHQMACCTCGTISPMSGAPFRVLPLSLVRMNPHSGRTSLMGSLNSALALLCEQEVVEDVQCAGLCRAKRKMFRKSSLGKLPRTFCIQLTRRFFDPRTGAVSKLQHHVAFPVKMEFGPFSFHRNGLQRREQELLSNFAALGVPSPATSSAAPLREDIYDLRAVIVHHGSSEGGHFTAFRQAARGHWLHTSDANVRPVSERQVLAAQAYMLLYERRLGPSMLLAP